VTGSRTWRVGIACPYSWSAMGGVQAHIRDFAGQLLDRGHEVSVLAPADDDEGLPDYVAFGGRPIALPYNGSVARLAFGPVVAARVRRWLSQGQFDLVHVHEPYSPSLSMLTIWAADVPLVGTWHMATERSRVLLGLSGVVNPSIEKITARIAVSEEARSTLVHHAGGDPILIPNGVVVGDYRRAEPRPQWRGTGGTVCFLGRLDEPRKGLPVLLEAWPTVLERQPDARLLVAGPGDAAEAAERLAPQVRDSVTWLGLVSDEDKAIMLRTADVYVGPHLGGESFGIVLVEAMAAGAAVVASDLPAFRAVLGDGRFGRLFPTGDAGALAAALLALVADPEGTAALRSRGSAAADRYDWSRVTDEVLAVYDLVVPWSSGSGPGAMR
jgi:phosphatidylinositol alpha-mannosyltransferase